MGRRKRRLGLLTGGGDSPGLNAVLRAIVKKGARVHGAEFVGILDGFQGLLEPRWKAVGPDDVSGIMSRAGTILGSTNRGDPFSYGGADLSSRVVDHAAGLGLDGLICLGGEGTMRIAGGLARKGLRIVGVPKTIDNDVPETDVTFGFDTAVQVVAEAADQLHATADAHRRVMVVEVMGRTAGWLALAGGLAGGADVILLPEIAGSMARVEAYIRDRHRTRRFTIAVVAEGARPSGIARSELRPGRLGQAIADRLEGRGIESRVTVLGHLQRSVRPTPADRLLATRFGAVAVDLAAAGRYGRMVTLRGGRVGSVPLARVAGRVKRVPVGHEWVRLARDLGTCLGDR